MAITLLPLKSITLKQLDQLVKITNDVEVMKWVGTGELWSESKIKNNILYLKSSPKNFMAWTIMKANDVIGYLAITGNRKEPEIRILIGKQYQGHGFATTTLKLLIKQMSRESKSQIHLVSYVKPDNIASNKIHIKVGFKLDGETIKYGTSFNKYIYVIKGKVRSHKRSKKIARL